MYFIRQYLIILSSPLKIGADSKIFFIFLLSEVGIPKWRSPSLEFGLTQFLNSIPVWVYLLLKSYAALRFSSKFSISNHFFVFFLLVSLKKSSFISFRIVFTNRFLIKLNLFIIWFAILSPLVSVLFIELIICINLHLAKFLY